MLEAGGRESVAGKVSLMVGLIRVIGESRTLSGSPMMKAALSIVDPGHLLGGLAAAAETRLTMVVLMLVYRGYGKLRVVSGRRTLNQQQRLFGKGRTAEECRRYGVPEGYANPEAAEVTWCPPEQSKHVDGRAIDISYAAYDEVPWQAIVEIAVVCRVVSGAQWQTKDGGHFEI